MSTIDIGGGESVQRRHLPKAMLSEFDEASATFSRAQANIRSWIKPLLAMQAPADASGDTAGARRRFIANEPGRSGRVYDIGEVGGAMLVDQRDVSAFAWLGFTPAPSQQPTSTLRVGLVFLDAATGEYLRYNGSAWAQVTLQ
jgi:hypothetical protein